MKKHIKALSLSFATAVIGLSLPLAIAQQVNPVQVVQTTFPPVTWTGSNAQCVASQLLNITNLDGSLVCPTNCFVGRNLVIVIRVSGTTNGVNAVSATIH
jgi:hypothetical protein